MIWHSGFAGPILGRGRNCFQDGAVVGLFRGPEEWQALVVGTKLYRVGAGIHRGEVSSLSCNCPYAREDQRCKHMAALFYALENRGQDVMEDDDAALSVRLDALSSDEARELLLLAIDANSTRCTALLLNRRRKDEEAAFSPDEFHTGRSAGGRACGREAGQAGGQRSHEAAVSGKGTRDEHARG